VSTTKQSQKHIEESDQAVVLHPDNNDLFLRTGKQIIAACRMNISIDVWFSEFNGMLHRVKGWVHEHESRVSLCYCAARGSQITFFFVPSSDTFDFDLADELVSLNSELVTSFNVGMVEIHQIPGGDVDRFLNPDESRLVYGDDRSAH